MTAERPAFLSPPLAEVETRCYRAGDPIDWWLHQSTKDSSMQKKKDAILSGLAQVIGNPQMADGQALTDIGDDANTPLKILFVLREDGDADLRFALAENHNIHRSVLSLLAEDANPYVAHRAQQTLSRLGHTPVLPA